MPIIRRSPLSRVFISRRFISTTPAVSQHAVTLGIRREDPDRIWERRCPLTPEAVEHLVHKEGIKVLVQDCDRRVFPIADFVKVRLRTAKGPHHVSNPPFRPAHMYTLLSSQRTLSLASRKPRCLTLSPRRSRRPLPSTAAMYPAHISCSHIRPRVSHITWNYFLDS